MALLSRNRMAGQPDFESILGASLGGPVVLPSGNESDGELYKLAVSGSRAATEEIVNRFHSGLLAYLRTKTSNPGIPEDAVADTWLKFFSHLKAAGRDSEVALRRPDSLRFWLYKTALNAMRTHFRQASRQSQLSAKVTAEANALGATAYSPDELASLVGEERQSAVRNAFERLSEFCKELLALVILDPPLSYVEIAEIVERPVGSLGPTRRRCLDQLRSHLVSVP